MGYHYSLDLRKKVVEARKSGKTVSAIMDLFGIARQTVYSWLERDRSNKLPAKIPDRSNTRKVDYQRVAEYVRENDDKYLYEIGKHFNLSAVAVFKILKKLKISYKKSLLYRRRDEGRREEFQQKLTKLLPEDVIFIDETGIEQEQTRGYGRSPRGQRVYGESSGGRVGRTTLIAGLYLGKLIAPLRFIGHTTTQVIIKWIRRVLSKVAKQGMTVILDNATFHTNQRVIQAFTDIGLNVMFLPPYSPDLNDIEPYWAILKKKLQALNTLPKNFNRNLDCVVRSMS